MQDDTNPIDDEIRDNEPRINADNCKLEFWRNLLRGTL